MKKLIAFVLIALMSVAAIACTQQSTKVEPAPVEATPEPVEEPSEPDQFSDILAFVNEGEIYFDLHVTDAIQNFTAEVDGKAIDGNTKAVPFTAESKIVFGGEANAEKAVDVYIIFGMKEDGQYRFGQSILHKMDADSVIESLASKVSGVLGGSAKLFIAVTDEGGQWDRSLNEKLNAFIDSYSVKE